MYFPKILRVWGQIKAPSNLRKGKEKETWEILHAETLRTVLLLVQICGKIMSSYIKILLEILLPVQKKNPIL